MTYAELAKQIIDMSKEQQKMTVTMRLPDDEFYAARLRETDQDSVILDPNHPYLEIKQ